MQQKDRRNFTFSRDTTAQRLVFEQQSDEPDNLFLTSTTNTKESKLVQSKMEALIEESDDVSVSSAVVEDHDESTQSAKTQERTSESSVKEIGYQESKIVYRSKLLVYLVLLFTALGAGILTFFLTRRQETNEFESEVCTPKAS